MITETEEAAYEVWEMDRYLHNPTSPIIIHPSGIGGVMAGLLLDAFIAGRNSTVELPLEPSQDSLSGEEVE